MDLDIFDCEKTALFFYYL